MGSRDFPKHAVTSTYHEIYIYQNIRGKVTHVRNVGIDPAFCKALEDAGMDDGTHTAEELLEALGA